MNLDFEKVTQRIKHIDDKVAQIKKMTSVSEKDFFAEEANIPAIKYLLLEAIEAVAAICLHISVRKLKKSVEKVGDCFENLYEAKIIDKTLYKKLKQMAKFRNMLAHHYHKIDDKLVFKYAQKDLSDFDDFIKRVGKILK